MLITQRIVDNIYEQFQDCFDGVRIFMLIHRNKEGGKSEGNDSNTTKRVSTSPARVREILLELVMKAYLDDKPWRIQMSVNPRDVDKAIRLFKQRQLDADYYDVDSKHSFYYDIKNRWISCLMNPASRASTKFLFDCDTPADYDATIAVLQKENIKIMKDYQTKNGRHIITEPHNPALTAIKPAFVNGHGDVLSSTKDGLMLLWWK